MIARPQLWVALSVALSIGLASSAVAASSLPSIGTMSFLSYPGELLPGQRFVVEVRTTDGGGQPIAGEPITLASEYGGVNNVLICDNRALSTGTDGTVFFNGCHFDNVGSYLLYAQAPGYTITGGTISVVTQLSQALTFGSLPSSLNSSSAAFQVSASSNSGLPVTISASGVCSISGSTVALLGPGVCTLTASQSGDATHRPGSTSTNLLVTSSSHTVQYSFGTPGTILWTVPPGITAATFDVFGAAGAGGAAGGEAVIPLAVYPGEVFQINVGGAGGGAYGGGGAASDIRLSPYGLADRILVGGGGGGRGSPYQQSTAAGGAGGYPAGGDGAPGSRTTRGGTGGTQTSGGVGGVVDVPVNGCNYSGGVGGLGYGGGGGVFVTDRGGAGGGGYYGGAGGDGGQCGRPGGGGGGSSTGPAGTAFSNGVRSGDGLVLVSYVGTISTVTTIATSAPLETLLGAVTYTATVTDPGGPATVMNQGIVTFKDAGTPIAGCEAVILVAGTATCTTTYGSPGGHTVRAYYFSSLPIYVDSFSVLINEAVDNTHVVFDYTGAAQTWTVPPGVTSATFYVFGASGGGAPGAGPGNGGEVITTMSVIPGDTYEVNVGGQGAGVGYGTQASSSPGGFNGGGSGLGPRGYLDAGGGGASDIRTGAHGLADRILVGGGGGGAGYYGGGSGGGYPTGAADGGACQGGGGSQTSGGQRGACSGNSSAGSLGQGGDGTGGGGGGGLYGGGGSGWSGGGVGGGGGSSFGPAGSTFINGIRGGDGQVLIGIALPVPAVAVSCPSSSLAVGDAVTCSVTATGSGGMAVTGTINWSLGQGAGAFTPTSCTLASSGTCSVSYSPALGSEGTHKLVATFPGSATLAAASGTYTLTVTRHSSSVTVSCNYGSATISSGNTVPCTASVSPATTAGTISWQLSSGPGSLSSTSCTLAAASCAITFSSAPGAAGTATVLASYGGNSDFTSSSGSFDLTVGPRVDGVGLACTPNPALISASLTCVGHVDDIDGGQAATPTGKITWNGGVQCTLAAGSCSITLAAPASSGTLTVTGAYSGSSVHQSNSTSLTVPVYVHSSTATVLTADRTTVLGAGLVSLRAAVTASTTGAAPISGHGTVTFLDGTTAIANCSLPASDLAYCSATLVGGGTHSVTATFAGDGFLDSSTSASIVITVNNTINGCLLQPLASCPGVDLSGQSLHGIDLHGSNFAGANLGGTDIAGANLSGANLTGVLFLNSYVSQTNLSDADFTGATLGDIYFSQANLTNVKLVNSSLTGVTLDNLYAGNIETGLDLTGAAKCQFYLNNQVDNTSCKGTLTLTLAPMTRIYGAPLPAPVLTYSGFATGDSVSILVGTANCYAYRQTGFPSYQYIPADRSSAPGQYTASCNAPFAALYIIGNQATSTLTINKAPLTITGSGTRPYGQPNPAFPLTVTGVQNNESVTVAINPDYPPATTPVGVVQAYADITPPDTHFWDNYDVLETISLTITKADLHINSGTGTLLFDQCAAVTPVGPATLPFTCSVPTPQVVYSVPPSMTGALVADALTAYAYYQNSQGVKPIGTALATSTYVNDPNSRLANYNLVQVAGTVTVVGPTINGCRLGPGAVCPGVDLSNASLEGLALTSGNFAGAKFDGANLDLVDFTGSDLRRATFVQVKYGSIVLGAGTDARGVTFDFADQYGWFTAPTPPSLCHTTFRTATYSYTADTSCPVLTATPNPATRVYGDGDPTLSVSLAGFIAGDTASGVHGQPACSSNSTASSPVGTYVTTCSGQTADLYSITYAPGVLTVTQAPLTITAADANRIFGSLNPTFSGTATGLRNGDAITVGGTTVATPASPGGGYPIVPLAHDSTPSRLANYTVTAVNGTLLVTPGSATITWAPSALVASDPLGPPQLNATAAVAVGGSPVAVAGTFAYTPAAGTLFAAGTVQTLSLTFTPSDLASVGVASATSTVEVLFPTPLLTSFSPVTVTTNTGPLQLAVTGANFAPGATLKWNGSPRPTTVADSGHLSASITGADVSSASGPATGIVTIVNPLPGGFVSAPTVYTAIPSGSGPYESRLAVGPGSVSASATGSSPTTAELTHTGPGTAVLTVLTYTGNPTPNTLDALGFLDVRLIGAGAADSLLVTVTFPPGMSDVAIANFVLRYFDGTNWVAVTGSGGSAPVKDLTARTISVTFDSTSTPRLSLLSGSVFALYQLVTQTIAFPAITGKVYGVAPFAAGASVNSPLPLSLTFTGPCASPDGSTVVVNAAGTCTVTASQAGNLLYAAAAPVSRQFLIAPTGLVISADNKTRAYGGADPNFTASFAGLVNGDLPGSLTGTLVIVGAPSGSHVGSYAIQVSGLSSPNYTVTFTTGTEVVTAVGLVITASDRTKVYGAAMPALSVTYAGFVNGDSADALSVQPSVSTSATASSHVASSPFVIAATGAVDTDYTISYVAGTMTVSPAVLTISADNKSKTYGATPPLLTATYSGFANGDTTATLASPPNSAPTLSTAVSSSSAVGNYAIAITGASDGDYTINHVAGSLEVTPAPAAVVVNNGARVFHGADPIFTGSVSGLFFGDTVAYSTTAVFSSSTGTYPITAAVVGPSAVNYQLAVTPGVLTVTPAPTALAFTATTQTVALSTAPCAGGCPLVMINRDGDLRVRAADVINAGYRLRATPGSVVSVIAASITLTEVCGAGRTVVFTIPLPDRTFTTSDWNWVPAGQGTDPASYQGSLILPSTACPGRVATMKFAATFVGSAVSQIQFHAGDPRWRGMASLDGSNALAPTAPAIVKATLTAAGVPVPGEVVTLSRGTGTTTAITDANGVAVATFTLANGAYTLRASFAGDGNYSPTATVKPLTLLIFMPTNYVTWGGNLPDLGAAVKVGQDVLFLSDDWARQVRAGNYHADNSFKGYAGTVSGTSWTATADDQHSARPHVTPGEYIGIIVTTEVARSQDLISGNIAETVIVRVDGPSAQAVEDPRTLTGLVQVVGVGMPSPGS